MLVCTSMYWAILVYTNIYCNILTGECVYLYIPVYTVTYKYRLVHTSTYQYKHVCARTYWFILYILVHTSTYQSIPVHTHADQGSEKMQTGFELEIFCILFACIPLHCKSTDIKYRIWNNGNDCVYIYIVHNPACVPDA